mmetsp:Transcript_28321/g.65570  ORF Transcript_28321/g.65570 Transcript_28321/m.65570 type:complete len:326 (+) Transcript_28321:185-1162(+)
MEDLPERGRRHQLSVDLRRGVLDDARHQYGQQGLEDVARRGARGRGRGHDLRRPPAQPRAPGKLREPHLLALPRGAGAGDVALPEHGAGEPHVRRQRPPPPRCRRRLPLPRGPHRPAPPGAGAWQGDVPLGGRPRDRDGRGGRRRGGELRRHNGLRRSAGPGAGRRRHRLRRRAAVRDHRPPWPRASDHQLPLGGEGGWRPGQPGGPTGCRQYFPLGADRVPVAAQGRVDAVDRRGPRLHCRRLRGRRGGESGLCVRRDLARPGGAARAQRALGAAQPRRGLRCLEAVEAPQREGEGVGARGGGPGHGLWGRGPSGQVRARRPRR